ncbi:hypothetical protein [Streptomyces halobius]|uniref:Uncharacterized protein n=1 Tax=Streptomyces halobius TaxID=2879846 RepID=A0ABY4M667_9ACTN|nr:hypothetical protein [Streptomyces halobius]UQA92962.1 hypothetical protein K9S39_14960 [Streptomyces halobius]
MGTTRTAETTEKNEPTEKNGTGEPTEANGKAGTADKTTGASGPAENEVNAETGGTADDTERAEDVERTGDSERTEDIEPTEASELTDPTEPDADDASSAPEAPSAGVAAGAGAVVAAGLGLASVTGTWLGTLMAERQALVGQIKLQSGRATDQIATLYGAPWHTTALVNGVFALLAVLVATVVLTRPRTTWVRAVAWGGLALGVLGLLISAGMYFDLFASLPSIPKGAGAGS